MTIIFVRFGTFSHTNLAVKRLLEAQFPDADVVDVNIAEVFKKSLPNWLAINFHGVLEYGADVLLGRKKLQVYRWRTSFLCQLIKKYMSKEFGGRQDILFTFQTQSLFDASIPGIPHFLYSDHTLLANLEYPDIDFDQYQYSRKWRALEKTFYHHAACVFTMSTNVSRSLERDYDLPSGQIACVGVGANAFEGISRADLGERPQEKYSRQEILFVGSIWELKGGPEVIQAFRSIRKRFPDAVLNIVGVAPTIDEPGVFVHGRVPLAKVLEFFRNASVFCMPSKGDAFGIVFLESFFFRVPVIALNIGAAPDIIEHGKSGFLLEPGDQTGLEDALVELLNDPKKCKQFGDHGFESVYPRFTWSNVGKLIQENIERRIAT